jgi:hypothetical protein
MSAIIEASEGSNLLELSLITLRCMMLNELSMKLLIWYNIHLGPRPALGG